jgi:hypothetical protein
MTVDLKRYICQTELFQKKQEKGLLKKGKIFHVCGLYKQQQCNFLCEYTTFCLTNEVALLREIFCEWNKKTLFGIIGDPY